MGLEPHTLERPACPYCGSNANERFGLNLEDDQCALIPTNSGSNKCILINGSYNPHLTKRRGDLHGGFGCPLNTEENRIKLTRRLEEIEKRSQEIQIKAYEKLGAVEKLPPGIALGSVETVVEKYLKLTPLGGNGRRRKN
ncbi:unnamed protein product [marine sediment metagenome]|uniref:Uncharacterized protein n=1 Tax=marine sediment metagenome TaxID=412755 RepID=X1C9V9_9ZZZZ